MWTTMVSSGSPVKRTADNERCRTFGLDRITLMKRACGMGLDNSHGWGMPVLRKHTMRSALIMRMGMPVSIAMVRTPVVYPYLLVTSASLRGAHREVEKIALQQYTFGLNQREQVTDYSELKSGCTLFFKPFHAVMTILRYHVIPRSSLLRIAPARRDSEAPQSQVDRQQEDLDLGFKIIPQVVTRTLNPRLISGPMNIDRRPHLDDTEENSLSNASHRKFFCHCRTSEAKAPTSDSAPLLLLRVCSSWRTIALQGPSLWASLTVAIGDDDASCPPLAEVSCWLKRSGVLPLRLALVQRRRCWQPEWDAVTGDMIALFMLHLPRWENVELDLGAEELFRHVAGLSIPWSQIVRIEIVSVPSVGCALTILKACGSLEELQMSVDAGEEDSHLPALPLALRRLHFLALHLSAHQLGVFLSHVVFPSLRTLMLRVDDGLQWLHSSIIRFLSQSCCILERLELYNPVMSTMQLTSCLKQKGVQEISTLLIHSCDGWPGTLPVETELAEQLSSINGTSSFLPNLTVLKMESGPGAYIGNTWE
ncbi:hypothetical protein DFH06DRAFT_1297475 [Mycena polygramma]|nr:hypothetical protein DFH06DRAFT_1297475 [Mycena polygramma]